MTIAVLLVDGDGDSRTERVGQFARCDGIRLVGAAANSVAAVEATRSLAPDVVLVDLELPDRDCLQTVRQLRRHHQRPPVCVLAASDEAISAHAQDVVLAVRAGARGCLYTQADSAVLGAAIRTVAAGGAAVPPLLAHALLLAFGRTRSVTALTPPERQVLHLLGEGMTEADTAQRLAIAESAVGFSLCRTLDKLAANGNRPPEVLGAGVPRRPSPPMLDASAAAMPDADRGG